jgi:hypothetical protein
MRAYPRVSQKERHAADTRSEESGDLQRLADGHPANGTPGAWTRAASSQMDQPERKDPPHGRD